MPPGSLAAIRDGHADALELAVGDGAVAVTEPRVDRRPVSSRGPRKSTAAPTRTRLSQPGKCRGWGVRLRAGATRGRGRGAVRGAAVCVEAPAGASAFGGSEAVGGGKNRADGPDAESSYADVGRAADGVVLGRGVRALPAPEDAAVVRLGGRDDVVGVGRVVPASSAAAVGRSDLLVLDASREPDDPGGVVLSARPVRLASAAGGPDARFEDVVPRLERAAVFQEASQTTQATLSCALCVPQAAQFHARVGASDRRGVLRRAGLASSQIRHVFLLGAL